MGACEWQVVAERRPGGPVGRTPRRIHHRPAGWICPELSLNSRSWRSPRHRVPPHELLHVRHRYVSQPHRPIFTWIHGHLIAGQLIVGQLSADS